MSPPPSPPPSSSDSDRDDDFNEDMDALRRACTLTGLSPAAADFSDTDSNSAADASDTDIDLLRRLQARLALPSDSPTRRPPPAAEPLALIPSQDSDDEDDDFATLRSIQRRFSQYETGADAINMKSQNCFEEIGMVVTDVTTGRETPTFQTKTGRETPDILSESTKYTTPVEDFPDYVTTKLNHTEDDMYNTSAKAFTYSQFPKSAQYFVDALRKNRSCQKFMRRKLIEIEAKIEENKELRERIKCLMDFQGACRRRIGHMLRQEKDPRVRLISIRKSPTAKAVGKLPALFLGPPENSHVSKYKMTMKMFPVSLRKLEWSDIDNEKLVKGVKQQYQEMLILNSMNFESDFGSSGDRHVVPAPSSSDLEVTPEKIRSFLPLVNWDRLASMYLTDRSGAECESRWINCEDPMVNRGPWTAAEERKLLYIVQQRGVYNWIDIAIALGTHRTPYQCLLLYQRSLNPHILNRDWTDEEDSKLRAAVEAFGNKWQVIASSIEGRSGPQCSNRWRKSLAPERKKVGRWSVDEDKCLKVSVMLFGAKQWNKIAQYVPGRTQAQCRERWLNCLDPSLKQKSWTEEEDAKLLAAISEHGYRWSKVATCVPPRTDNQCRRRWTVLLPDEVPFLQAAKKMRRTVLQSNFVDRESERPLIGPGDFVPLTLSYAAEDVNNKTVTKKASSNGLPKKSNAQSKISLVKSLIVDCMVNSYFEIARVDSSPVLGVNISDSESGRIKRTRKNQPKKPSLKSSRCIKKNSKVDGVNSSSSLLKGKKIPRPKESRAKPRRLLEKNPADALNSSFGTAPGDLSLVPDTDSTMAKNGSMKKTRKKISSNKRPSKSSDKFGSSIEENITADPMIPSSSEIARGGLSPTPGVSIPVAAVKRRKKRTSSDNLPKIAKSGISLEKDVTVDAMIKYSSETAPACVSSVVNSAVTESGNMKRTGDKTSRSRAESSLGENLAADAVINCSSEIDPSDPSLVPGINPTTAENGRMKRIRKRPSRYQE